MSNAFQDRLEEIERRKSQQRKGKELTTVQRIDLQRSGGDRRVMMERRTVGLRA